MIFGLVCHSTYMTSLALSSTCAYCSQRERGLVEADLDCRKSRPTSSSSVVTGLANNNSYARRIRADSVFASRCNRVASRFARSAIKGLFIRNNDCCGTTLDVRPSLVARGTGKSNRRRKPSEENYRCHDSRNGWRKSSSAVGRFVGSRCSIISQNDFALGGSGSASCGVKLSSVPIICTIICALIRRSDIS